jgi:hypothetical protein
MNMYLEGFQVDPSQLDLEDDERAQLEAAANEKDVKVVVAEIQAESNRYRADLKVEFDELQLSIESSLKALTEENAVSTGELNAQVKVFQELLKVGQTPDNAGAAPPAAAPAAPAMPAMPAPQQNTDVNAALDILEQ